MKILLVEDERFLAASLKSQLEAEQFTVDVENDGDQGLYRARTDGYDLILLDNILPGKMGSEICKELREYKISTPVLILSIQSLIKQKVMLLDCGADDYLTKPFSPKELVARAKALVRRPRNVEEPRLRVGSLVLDRETFSVFRGEININLTAKEFMLLEYLMKNAEHAVTRGMILEHVWDETADPFSKSIEIHIMNLRKKIDAGHAHKFIRTIPARGYTLLGEA